MIVRMMSGYTQIGSINETQMQGILKNTVAHLREQKGFRKLYQTYNRETGQSCQIQFWDTQEDLDAYLNTDFAKNLAAKIATILAPITVKPAEINFLEVMGES